MILIFDLHCDALYRNLTEKLPLDSPKLKSRMPEDESVGKIQCYAIWIPDFYMGERAENFVISAFVALKNECKRLSLTLTDSFENIRESVNSQQTCRRAVFTVENGRCLNGDTDNVRRLASIGTKMMTLTWNEANEIGGGCKAEADEQGLTDFGRRVIGQMDKYGIVVDLSHSSDKLFYDAAARCTRPFVASHSNSRTITDNKRNLTDEQFSAIRDCGGLVGLCFHDAFLNNNPQNACKTDILKHAEHFLSLGGENVLALGSDFDGCSLPNDISGSEDYYNIYEMFLKHNYSETLVRKIFYENALNFFENFDNHRIM